MSRALSEEVIPGRAAISVNDPGTDVPEGWTRVLLTNVARLESGHTPSRKHPEWWGGDVPWVSLPDAREHHGRVIHDTTQKTNELGLANSAARWLPKDTVCLSRTASVGYVFRLGCPMATSQDFVNWVCSEALEPRFLQQALLAEGKHILNFGMGTTHTTIYFPAVLAFHVTLAPLPEQRRIVEKVEALLADVNKAKERLDRVPLILKRFRQAVLAAACSGELTREWRESRSFPAQSSGSALDVPETWGVGPFSLVLTELRNGVSPRPSLSPPGLPILRISAARAGSVDLADTRYLVNGEDYGEALLRDGDLLFTRYNGSIDLLGVCGVVRGLGERRVLYPDKLMRVRLDSAVATSDYIEVFFGSSAARHRLTSEAKSSAGQQGISGQNLKDQLVALPPLDEQAEIVRQVGRLFGLADTIERRVQDATARANKLPQAILSKAFSGELVPTEADIARAEGRTYETAEELLAKVRRGADSGGATDARRGNVRARRVKRGAR